MKGAGVPNFSRFAGETGALLATGAALLAAGCSGHTQPAGVESHDTDPGRNARIGGAAREFVRAATHAVAAPPKGTWIKSSVTCTYPRDEAGGRFYVKEPLSHTRANRGDTCDLVLGEAKQVTIKLDVNRDGAYDPNSVDGIEVEMPGGCSAELINNGPYGWFAISPVGHDGEPNTAGAKQEASNAVACLTTITAKLH